MQRVADGAATLGIHMVTDGATTPDIHMTSISKVSDLKKNIKRQLRVLGIQTKY